MMVALVARLVSYAEGCRSSIDMWKRRVLDMLDGQPSVMVPSRRLCHKRRCDAVTNSGTRLFTDETYVTGGISEYLSLLSLLAFHPLIPYSILELHYYPCRLISVDEISMLR